MRKDLLVVAGGLIPTEVPLHPLVLKAAELMRPVGHD
jgi:hypothetical protein